MATWERWLIFLLRPVGLGLLTLLVILPAVFGITDSWGGSLVWHREHEDPEPLTERCAFASEGFNCVLDAGHPGEHKCGGG